MDKADIAEVIDTAIKAEQERCIAIICHYLEHNSRHEVQDTIEAIRKGEK